MGSMDDSQAVDRAVAATREYLASRPAPDLTADVMRRIAAAPPPRRRTPRAVLSRAIDVVWTSRRVTFQFRPAYAAAAALLILIAAWPMRSAEGPERAATARPPEVLVQFRLEAEDASDVSLAGSFSDWQPSYQLHQTAPGLWSITLPLTPGVHDYAFVVDGTRWVADPYAPQVDDGFGGANSRIVLVTTGASQT